MRYLDIAEASKLAIDRDLIKEKFARLQNSPPEIIQITVRWGQGEANELTFDVPTSSVADWVIGQVSMILGGKEARLTEIGVEALDEVAEPAAEPAAAEPVVDGK